MGFVRIMQSQGQEKKKRDLNFFNSVAPLKAFFWHSVSSCLSLPLFTITMGYATLDAALAFPNNLPPTQTHIVVTDTLKSDGNFLIHHFLSNQLKTDRRVVLVGLAQIFNHYFLINRKLVRRGTLLS